MDINSVASTPAVLPGITPSPGEGSPVAPAPNVQGTASTAAASPNTPNTQQVSQNSIDQAVKQVNDSLNQWQQNLYATFTRDKTTGIEVIEFTDKTTHQVISQIPSKAMIALAQTIDANGKIQGNLLDSTA